MHHAMDELQEKMSQGLEQLETLTKRLEATASHEARHAVFKQAESTFDSISQASEQYHAQLSEAKDAGRVSSQEYVEAHQDLQTFHEELNDLLARIHTAVNSSGGE